MSETLLESEFAVGMQPGQEHVDAEKGKSRHQQTSATLNDLLQQIQGVSNEQVGTELLTLQTRMQASMQTTAMLFQTSLVNYLK